VLLRLGADAPITTQFEQAAAARKVPLTIVALSEPQVLAAYQRRLVLVRPDGHVAWRADAEPADAGALIDTVRGQPTHTRQQQGQMS
jgi:Aromatic-ring hydroxylase, C-terminal